jgi:hypothetical protein
MHSKFWSETPKGTDYSEDLGDIRIDLRDTGWKNVEWFYVAQDKDQERPLANTVTNLRIP